MGYSRQESRRHAEDNGSRNFHQDARVSLDRGGPCSCPFSSTPGQGFHFFFFFGPRVDHFNFCLWTLARSGNVVDIPHIEFWFTFCHYYVVEETNLDFVVCLDWYVIGSITFLICFHFHFLFTVFVYLFIFVVLFFVCLFSWIWFHLFLGLLQWKLKEKNDVSIWTNWFLMSDINTNPEFYFQKVVSNRRCGFKSDSRAI